MGQCLKNAGATQISIIENYEQFSIYPNPANDMIIINLEKSTETELSIYESGGNLGLRKQLNQPGTAINIENFPEGIYIVSVKNSERIMQKKLIKTTY